MYVDVTSILQNSGLTVLEWADYIRNEIMINTGCPCSTGFGTNRLQARLATKKAKPAGKYYLKPDDVEEYFSEINLSDLPGVGPATLSKLRNMGLNTCGDIQVYIYVNISINATKITNCESEYRFNASSNGIRE